MLRRAPRLLNLRLSSVQREGCRGLELAEDVDLRCEPLCNGRFARPRGISLPLAS